MAPFASANSLVNISADVNPIGGISKTDLKKFIAYAQDTFDLPILARWPSRPSQVFGSKIILAFSFLDAVPTAELEPITETYVQADEVNEPPKYIFFFPILTPEHCLAGRHGNDIRRAFCIRQTTKSWEMWTVQHVHQACPRMGIVLVPDPGLSQSYSARKSTNLISLSR